MTTGDWVGLAATLIVATVMIVLWTKERHSRGLSYSILTNRPLITGEGTFPLVVKSGDQTLARPHLVVWRLVNVGAQAIEQSDYEEGITFTAKGARVISADVTDSRPPGVRPTVTVKDATVSLEKRLLNGRDMVEVQMLVDGKPFAFDVNCRIKGISKVEKIKLPRTSWNQPWQYSTVDKIGMSLAFLLLGGIGLYFILFLAEDLGGKILGWVLAITGLLICPALLVRSNFRNKLFLG
jgi:hypothetical protein